MISPNFTKIHLSYDEQISLLESRGLIVSVKALERKLKNWLHVINHIRNVCAHHGRLWNKQFAIKAQVPKKVSRFKDMRNDKIFILIVILSYMFQRLDTADNFSDKIKKLIDEYPEIPLKSMGFTDDWYQRLKTKDSV